MKVILTPALVCTLATALFGAQNAPVGSKGTSAPTLNSVKRIYIGELSGGTAANAIRELIIAGITSTKLFVLTENPEHADAVLKGAADDNSFEDVFDSSSGISSRSGGGNYKGSSVSQSKLGGNYSSNSIGDNESHHIRERKHEAFAAVRLVSMDGDILWSTSQESNGAKFRSASADVASKVAHQLSFDYEIAGRTSPRPPNP